MTDERAVMDVLGPMIRVESRRFVRPFDPRTSVEEAQVGENADVTAAAEHINQTGDPKPAWPEAHEKWVVSVLLNGCPVAVGSGDWGEGEWAPRDRVFAAIVASPEWQAHAEVFAFGVLRKVFDAGT